MDGKPVVLHALGGKDTEYRVGGVTKLNGVQFFITETDSETHSITLRLGTFDELHAAGHLVLVNEFPGGKEYREVQKEA